MTPVEGFTPLNGPQQSDIQLMLIITDLRTHKHVMEFQGDPGMCFSLTLQPPPHPPTGSVGLCYSYSTPATWDGNSSGVPSVDLTGERGRYVDETACFHRASPETWLISGSERGIWTPVADGLLSRSLHLCSVRLRCSPFLRCAARHIGCTQRTPRSLTFQSICGMASCVYTNK